LNELEGRMASKVLLAIGAVRAVAGWPCMCWRAAARRPLCAVPRRPGGRRRGASAGRSTLVNAAGETVTDADVITEPSLIYFGYTFCPDVCPLDTARNAEAVEILEAARPDRHAGLHLDRSRARHARGGRDFAANHASRMIGLTGSPEQVRAASQAYKTYYRKQDGDEFYLVDHSTFTYLVLPEDGFVEFFRRDLTAEEMADRVACFLDAGGV
jgi:protein SCO1/2